MRRTSLFKITALALAILFMWTMWYVVFQKVIILSRLFLGMPIAALAYIFMVGWLVTADSAAWQELIPVSLVGFWMWIVPFGLCLRDT